MHVCLVTIEHLNRDYALSGGALRVMGLADAFKKSGCRVSFLRQKSKVEPSPFEELFELEEICKDGLIRMNLAARISEINPDVIIVEQWGLLDQLEGIKTPIFCDLHGSLLWENYYRGQRGKYDLRAKMMALSRCNGFLVPGLRQKYYFLAFAMAAGMDMAQERILHVPLLLPEEWYKGYRQKEPEPDVICGGGNWPWIDMGDRDWVKEWFQSKGLLFKEFTCVAQQSALNPDHLKSQTSDSGVPHQRIPKLYSRAMAAWDWYAGNRERELAITTRTVEYLYCGIPVFYPQGLELSEFIEKHGLGILLSEPKDLENVKNLENRLLQARDNLRAGLHEYLKPETIYENLMGFIKNPKALGVSYDGMAALEAEKRQLVQKNQALMDENEHLLRVQKKLLSDLRIQQEEKSELALRWSRDIKRLGAQKTG
ncbi:MAG: hypothetical protein H3C47_03625 [Candidatus Cloacimonetes bacterium]|nr:hypothetical protein [Candidatus Cloacimonadota bacterium]